MGKAGTLTLPDPSAGQYCIRSRDEITFPASCVGGHLSSSPTFGAIVI